MTSTEAMLRRTIGNLMAEIAGLREENAGSQRELKAALTELTRRINSSNKLPRPSQSWAEPSTEGSRAGR